MPSLFFLFLFLLPSDYRSLFPLLPHITPSSTRARTLDVALSRVVSRALAYMHETLFGSQHPE